MQLFLVKVENVTSFGRTFSKGSKIEMERIHPDHFASLIDQKAIEPCDDDTVVPYQILDAE